MGTWWRLSRSGAGVETLRAAHTLGTQWAFVGSDAGAPLVYTVASDDLDLVSPTYTKRTPAGTDDLYGVGYASAENLTVAVGSNATVEESTNKGASWSQQNLAGNDLLLSVVGVTGSATALMVASGVDVIWGRDNAGVWTTRWTGSQIFNEIAYMSGQGWVAVGGNGKGTHSATAANGSFAAPFNITQAGANLNSLASNSTYFVAVGNDGNAYRSLTGQNLSWSRFGIDPGTAFIAVIPTANNNKWAAITTAGAVWTSSDNGQTWTLQSTNALTGVQGGHGATNRSALVGTSSRVWVSNNQEQADHVPVATPAPPLAFSENDDMAGDAVRRLSTQFRS